RSRAPHAGARCRAATGATPPAHHSSAPHARPRRSAPGRANYAATAARRPAPEQARATAARSSAPAERPRHETRADTAVLSSTPRLLPTASSRKHRSVNRTGSTSHRALRPLSDRLAVSRILAFKREGGLRVRAAARTTILAALVAGLGSLALA